jgi:hypothetical protein
MALGFVGLSGVLTAQVTPERPAVTRQAGQSPEETAPSHQQVTSPEAEPRAE